MSILGRKEYKTQLYFRDDNKFEFKKREVKFSCLVAKVRDELTHAWKHFFNNQYYFAGYKRISADTVTLGYSRDIILDPFNRVPIGIEPGEKPKAEKQSLRDWIAKVATTQRHTFSSKRQQSRSSDVINWSLAVVLLIMIMSWAITFLRSAF